MGRVTLRVEKQNPVVDSDEYPECALQFRLPGFEGVGDITCFGDCGRIEINRGETKLQTLVAGDSIIAPCGQRVKLERVDN